MKILLPVITALTLHLSLLNPALAQKEPLSNINTSSIKPQIKSTEIRLLEKNLAKNFPDLQISHVETTPLSGIYEVGVDDRLIYTDTAAQYFFVSHLLDLKQQKNLTEQRLQYLSKIDIKQLPLEQAIKIVKGNGSRHLYIFSDPDCPFCQKLEQELSQLNNLTLYIFPYPIKELHPNAEQIAKQIWCAPDRAVAWENYMLKKQQSNKNTECNTDVLTENIKLGKQLKITGTPTLFLADGQRITGMRSSEEIEALLKTVAK